VVDPQASSTTYVYDAWNRMVEMRMEGNAVQLSRYDGLGRRITRQGGGVVTHDYFNDRWQLIEQRKDAATTASAQFAWSAVYIDALLQEKRDTDADGTLDRTLFVTHDANFNVTAAVSPTGIVAERYLYDAYGERWGLGGDWQPGPADG
jgi:YD repeat-containing protein